MEEKRLEIEAAIQIRKTPGEVFDAITDPAGMSNYFISWGSAVMEEGKEIMWKFPEFESEFPIRVRRLEKDACVSFTWGAEGQEMLVEMTLTPRGPDSTVVRVTEKSMPFDEAGLKWVKGNTQGWANFLACLKAYLEYGINLRKGAFDFLADK
jgi:uncharacterized protein YndB with AHSA1/START domain